jgi:hypothetical protein
MMTPGQLAAELERRLDGPHAGEHTAAAAHLCAEAVRFLAYAAGPHSPEGLAWPSTVYEVTAGLSLAAHRMPQLFGQLAAWLDAEESAGHLAMDDGSPARAAVAIARGRLEAAAALAGRLGAVLAGAQNVIGGLNGRGPDRPGGQ